MNIPSGIFLRSKKRDIICRVGRIRLKIAKVIISSMAHLSRQVSDQSKMKKIWPKKNRWTYHQGFFHLRSKFFHLGFIRNRSRKMRHATNNNPDDFEPDLTYPAKDITFFLSFCRKIPLKSSNFGCSISFRGDNIFNQKLAVFKNCTFLTNCKKIRNF